MNFIKTSIAAILILVLSACTKKYIEIYPPASQVQKIYFEHYVINYAWGLNYLHWVIDNEGKVRINHKRDSIIWINEKELNTYITKFDSVVYQVDKNELNKYVALIESAATGRIDSIQMHRADFGSTGYNCFWYNKTTKSYSSILLSMMSDPMDKTNMNTHAAEIDNWLKQVQTKAFYKK